jgi:putative hydrolase of the HAD superfamily
VIRAVISDFGGVLTTPLIDSFMAYQRESGIRFEDIGRAMVSAMEKLDGRHPLFELEKGNLTEAEFLDLVGSELGEPLHSLRETYFRNLHPNEQMIDFIRDLRARGLRTALLTNNVREWEPLWREKLPDVDEIFEVIVDSGFVGMRKPEPRIYELTLDRLGNGLSPAECVFVDDIEVNCDAARELGMVAIHFRDNDQAIAEIEAAVG